MPDTDPDFSLTDNTLTHPVLTEVLAQLAAPRVHPTAIIEANVSLGRGTSVWDNVHIRHDTTVGDECIVGEKTYIAYGVRIGHRVKINSMVYICTAVTIEDGVMISAGTIFTNDRFPRATTPDLKRLRSSDPDEHTLPTRVREGATIGAGCTIGNDLTIGRFAMIGMGALVTKSIPDFALAIGHPAVPVGAVCRCGQLLFRYTAGRPPARKRVECGACRRQYVFNAGQVEELDGATTPPPRAGARSVT
ncbi:MAG: N-acetyltransferase [Planctomycetes bacterium]|nr:N-acetyltransferase [Planctomycetota bacterium]